MVYFLYSSSTLEVQGQISAGLNVLSGGSSEDMLKVKLIPNHFRLDTTPLPAAINLFEKGGHSAVSVTLDRHVFLSDVLESLMCCARLMMRDNFLVRDFLPFYGSNEMLRGDERVAQEHGIAHHLNVLLGREVLEFGIVDFIIVDLIGSVS